MRHENQALVSQSLAKMIWNVFILIFEQTVLVELKRDSHTYQYLGDWANNLRYYPCLWTQLNSKIQSQNLIFENSDNVNDLQQNRNEKLSHRNSEELNITYMRKYKYGAFQ